MDGLIFSKCINPNHPPVCQDTEISQFSASLSDVELWSRFKGCFVLALWDYTARVLDSWIRSGPSQAVVMEACLMVGL